MQQVLINLAKKNLVNLKFDAGKLDIDKLKNVPSGLNSLKSKVLENWKLHSLI